MIFSNKTGAKSEKKRSSRAIVFFLRAAQKPIIMLCFFPWIEQKPRHMREKWKEYKKIKSTLNQTSSSYMCRQEGKECWEAFNGTVKHFFQHHRHPHGLPESNGVIDVCCAYVSSFSFFLCVKRQHHPITKQLLLKNYHGMMNWPLKNMGFFPLYIE